MTRGLNMFAPSSVSESHDTLVPPMAAPYKRRNPHHAWYICSTQYVETHVASEGYCTHNLKGTPSSLSRILKALKYIAPITLIKILFLFLVT